MRRTILILALLATATACSDSGATPSNKGDPLPAVTAAQNEAENAVAVAEPDAKAPGEVQPSNQALFAAEHPDEADCDAASTMEDRLEEDGYTQTTDEGATQTWTDASGDVIKLETSPMEWCIA